MKIKQHKDYPSMYWVVWPDGIKSQDFYNLTRAKDISTNLLEYLANMKKRIDYSKVDED